MDDNSHPPGGPAIPPEDRRLDSWKEIAAYLNRDVTTVRRWEKREGLPVHRQQHTTLGSVYAFTTEIDAWRSGREQPALLDEEQPAPLASTARVVGRESELGRLQDHLARVLGGERQTVFVAGELGLGKTALTRAFLGYAHSDVWVAAGQCVEQYGRSEPYLPIVDAIDRIIRDDRTREAIRIVNDRAPSWVDQFFPRAQPVVRRQRIAGREPGTVHLPSELMEVIEALAAVRPLVLLLEDLHWSDQATVELVARLARRPERARLLVIGTYRPAELFESGSPLLRVVRELRVHFQADEIELSQLSEEAVGELIARERTWHDLRGTAAILRRWSGNPLFLIHFIAHLERAGYVTQRDGRWALDLERQERVIPGSLRMLIEEQLDRLDSGHRQLLEVASVVGETFPAAILARMTPHDVTGVERALEDLCRRSHLVMPRGAGRLPDGILSTSYGFVHEFYRQVVYERLPQATVTELHRQIGNELQAAAGSRSAEISSELAMHFDRGQDFARAVELYCLAAEVAFARNADREAQLGLSRASELMGQLAAGPARDAMERHLCDQLGAVLARLGQALPWAATADPTSLALTEALTRLSYVHSLAGDLAAAKQIGDRAAAVGRLRGATPSETLAQQAYVRLLTGEFADSRSLVQQALVGDDAGDHAIWGRVRCSLVLALATWYLGRYDEARETVARILSTVGVDGEPRVAASVMPLLVWLGETGRSRDITRMATSAGHDDLLTGVLWPGDTGDGWIRVHGGQIAEGVFLLRRSAQRLGAISLRSWLPYTLAWLSEGLRIEGEPDDAAAAAEDGLNIVRQTGARCCDAELYRMRGEAIAARAGSRSGSSATRDHDAAEASCWAAITVARQQDARTLELQATLSLARLLRDTGRREDAVRVLAPVCDGFASSDRTPDLAEARRVIAEGAR